MPKGVKRDRFTHAQKMEFRRYQYSMIVFQHEANRYYDNLAKKRAEKEELDKMCDTVFKAVFGENYKEEMCGKDSEGNKN